MLERKYTYVDEVVESKSEKKIRIFLAVMFFIQTVMTTFPFLQGPIDETGEVYGLKSAFQLLIQPNGYNSSAEVFLALYGGVLVLLPIVAFFFCILDKKSRVKYIFTGLCSVVCAVLICFTGSAISLGALITLIINVVTLFMTSQGVMATNIRRRQEKSK